MNDICYAGVDGEEMDMAWQEITFATSNEHERMLDEIHEIMYKLPRKKGMRWKVRLSITTLLTPAFIFSHLTRWPNFIITSLT